MVQNILENILKARPLGSEGNEQVLAYIEKQLIHMGYEVTQLPLECTLWSHELSELTLGKTTIPVHPSPFSAPLDGTGPLVFVSTVSELEGVACDNAILLVGGALAQEPLQPKDYPFYYPDEHRHIIELLEEKKPLGIVAATGQHAMCGLNPFPLLEDGNFKIPSGYLPQEVFHELQQMNAGELTEAHLVIRSRHQRKQSRQLIGSKRALSSRGKILLCAHMDTKYNTLGALDNGAGLAVLLCAASELAHASLEYDLDIVPMNGEESYGAEGELAYLKHLGAESIALMINIDSPCHQGSKLAASFYSVEDKEQWKQRHPEVETGPQWYAGDHGAFAFQGVPCLALSSSDLFSGGLASTHTMKDTIDTVDVAQIHQAAEFIIDYCKEWISPSK